jgi:hypothetical protein
MVVWFRLHAIAPMIRFYKEVVSTETLHTGLGRTFCLQDVEAILSDRHLQSPFIQGFSQKPQSLEYEIGVHFHLAGNTRSECFLFTLLSSSNNSVCRHKTSVIVTSWKDCTFLWLEAKCFHSRTFWNVVVQFILIFITTGKTICMGWEFAS